MIFWGKFPGQFGGQFCKEFDSYLSTERLFSLAVSILGQLWKFNGVTLTNKANIWLSEDEWNLEEANDKRYYIENLSRDKVLGKGIYILGLLLSSLL